jgi:hypothetical protein
MVVSWRSTSDSLTDARRGRLYALVVIAQGTGAILGAGFLAVIAAEREAAVIALAAAALAPLGISRLVVGIRRYRSSRGLA